MNYLNIKMDYLKNKKINLLLLLMTFPRATVATITTAVINGTIGQHYEERVNSSVQLLYVFSSSSPEYYSILNSTKALRIYSSIEKSYTMKDDVLNIVVNQKMGVLSWELPWNCQTQLMTKISLSSRSRWLPSSSSHSTSPNSIAPMKRRKRFWRSSRPSS